MSSVITGTKQTMGEAYLSGERYAVTHITLTSTDNNELKPGAVCSIQGISKGKGFAGVVKRWGFSGGFKTHGQSDRHRAPGSIGQGTTPGRVHKGKKMAGRMGNQTHTVKQSLVIVVNDHDIWVTGPVPGNKGGSLTLTVTDQKEAPQVTFLTGGVSSSQPPSPTSEEKKEEVSKPAEEKSDEPQESANKEPKDQE